MARKRLFPNQYDLTALQLLLLDIVVDNPSIVSGHAAIMMPRFSKSAVGRAASALNKKGLLYYEHNWDKTDGEFEYWPEMEARVFRQECQEMFLAVAKHFGASDEEIEGSRDRSL